MAGVGATQGRPIVGAGGVSVGKEERMVVVVEKLSEVVSGGGVDTALVRGVMDCKVDGEESSVVPGSVLGRGEEDTVMPVDDVKAPVVDTASVLVVQGIQVVF